jgi:hypothetical protein
MEPQPPPPAVRISDVDRERAAEVLQRACGQGRMTLEEFSLRVGAVWAADTSAELEQVTSGLAEPPPVGQSQVVEKIVNVFGESKRHGRWRLPARMRLTNVFGSTELDLREAAVGPDAMAEQVVRIEGYCVFGELKVIVPEGVEAELSGSCVFGSRSIRLAPVQRLAGTPVIQVHVNVLFGEIQVRSRGPQSESPFVRWIKGTFS